MTPDARSLIDDKRHGRERSPLRVQVNRLVLPLKPPLIKFEWVCPACGDLDQGFLNARVTSWAAHTHARTCPALRLARLEAELEKEADHLAGLIAADDRLLKEVGVSVWHSGHRHGSAWAWYRLTLILARHRQASNG